MKLIQYTGPFKAGETINVPAKTDCTYTHIGIQVPYTERMINLMNKKIPLDLQINGIDYRINDTGILEFTDTSILSFTIKFLRDMPMETIVDITYLITDI